MVWNLIGFEPLCIPGRDDGMIIFSGPQVFAGLSIQPKSVLALTPPSLLQGGAGSYINGREGKLLPSFPAVDWQTFCFLISCEAQCQCREKCTLLEVGGFSGFARGQNLYCAAEWFCGSARMNCLAVWKGDFIFLQLHWPPVCFKIFGHNLPIMICPSCLLAGKLVVRFDVVYGVWKYLQYTNDFCAFPKPGNCLSLGKSPGIKPQTCSSWHSADLNMWSCLLLTQTIEPLPQYCLLRLAVSFTTCSIWEPFSSWCWLSPESCFFLTVALHLIRAELQSHCQVI